MDISSLIPHIESLIFASDKPLAAEEITELINNAFGFMEDKIATEQVEAALEGIVEKYSSEFYPFEVRQSGGGWQFLTKKDYHKTVAQLNGEKFLKRLSAAALETLSIIAYKQPITKGEIEAIRGVSADYAVQKLLEKDLIVISGRNEEMPGHPLVYATSKSFMDYFGLNTPDDLPKIKEVLAEGIVTPTTINHTEFEEPSALVVTDEGELVGELDSDDAPVLDDAATAIELPSADGDGSADEARLFIHDTEKEDENEASEAENEGEADEEDEDFIDGTSFEFLPEDEIDGAEVEGMAREEDAEEEDTDEAEDTGETDEDDDNRP